MHRPFLFLALLLSFCPAKAAVSNVLRSIGEINGLTKLTSHAKKAVAISGQVVSVYNNGRFPVIWMTDGQATLAFANCTTNACQSGDIIRITGYVNRNPTLGEEGIFADTLTILGNKSLPTTRETLSAPNASGEFGQLQGVIAHVVRDETDANYNWIVLRTPYGELYASATEAEHPYERLVRLVDAEVLLRGIVSRGPYLRKPGGLNLMLYGKEGLQVLHPPPQDPFSAPAIDGKPSVHRQRISGTVIAIGRTGTFVRTDDGRFLQVSTAIPHESIRPGEYITAVGFAANDRDMILFTDALIRSENGITRPSEDPLPIAAVNLFSDQFGNPGINAGFHGKTVRLHGILANSPTDIQLTGTLRLELGKHSVFVDCSPLSEAALASFEPGMTLGISGICLAEFDANEIGSTFPSFRRFLIVPRSSADVVVLARRPWWTPLKLLVVISLLALAIVAVLVWNRSLRILSERRGHALSLALTARVRAESRTQERTRLALELHDSISQSLTGVALQIDAATTTSPIDDARRNAYLTTAKNLLASCRKSLQDCLWDLRSRTFEEKNLTEAISRTLAPFLNKCTILVRFNIPRETLSESATHAVLSIIRELTANALRHGHATHVRIAGEFRDGCVRFSVTDNGSGFDTDLAPGPRDGHFGLQGIRERVNDFNGTINLSSAPDKGTKAIVTLAVGETEHANEEKRA